MGAASLKAFSRERNAQAVRGSAAKEVMELHRTVLFRRANRQCRFGHTFYAAGDLVSCHDRAHTLGRACVDQVAGNAGRDLAAVLVHTQLAVQRRFVSHKQEGGRAG